MHTYLKIACLKTPLSSFHRRGALALLALAMSFTFWRSAAVTPPVALPERAFGL